MILVIVALGVGFQNDWRMPVAVHASHHGSTEANAEGRLTIVRVEQVVRTNIGVATVKDSQGEFTAYYAPFRDIKPGTRVKVLSNEPANEVATKFIYEIGPDPPGPRVISPGTK